MIDFGTALQLAVAVAMPFILYILHGIRSNLHELRNQIQPVITEQAVQRTEIDIVKKQLRLMDESPA